MTPSAETAPPAFREIMTDALRYWEPRRVIYNAVLAGIVVYHFTANRTPFRLILNVTIHWFFLLAVLANLAYCAAYIADIPVQFSGFRPVWKRYRWILFLVGLALASIIAWDAAPLVGME